MSKKKNAGNIKLCGGSLCLNFVNTVHCYGCEDIGEYLNTYTDLVAWSRHVGTISAGEAKTLSHRAARHPAEAKSVHRRAIELREAVYRIFTMTLEGRAEAREEIAVFNNYLAGALKQSAIVKTDDGFSMEITGNKENLDWMLNPVIRSAANLMVSKKFKRVKKCADPTCGWLFLDTSRNRSRRWCDMRDCGNRAKASRFYKKKSGQRK